MVDDNADMARLTGRFLKSIGYQVQVAHDGKNAVDTAREHRPDVVLLDIGLPGMDGYEVARQLRQDECCSHSLIIAVSGYGDGPSLEQGRAAGFDHHLTKPVDIDSLVSLMAQGKSVGA